MTAGRAGGQRLRPHGDARPPHEQGGGRAAFRFGWSGSGSRRRQAHEQGTAVCRGVRWATLPCPLSKGGAASVQIRRCLPLRGKGASELARLILEVSRERTESRGALPIRNGWQARRGTGGAALTARAFCGKHSRHARKTSRRPFAAFSMPAKSGVPAPPRPLFSRNHPAGRPAGSARTRSRVSSLENPFLGNGSHFPTAPSPKPPQAASPCSWTCLRLHALSPHSERNAANPPPARGAGLRQHGAEGAGRRPCRPALDSHPFPCYNGRTRGEGCF